MKKSPYSKFDNSDLILRDELAVDRTLLANERTLLAYLRLGIALVIAGLSIMEFARADWYWVIGIVCIPGGLTTSIVGVLRYLRMNASISILRKQSGKDGTAEGPTPV